MPGVKYVDWPVADPGGQDEATVRRIIADLDDRVRTLLVELVPDIDLPPSVLVAARGRGRTAPAVVGRPRSASGTASIAARSPGPSYAGQRRSPITHSSRWCASGLLPSPRGDRPAVTCAPDHGRRSGADDGTDHHVPRVVHAGVDPRIGRPRRKQPDRHGQPRQVPADRVGERERRRGVTGREGGRFRHRTNRRPERGGSARSGRRRRASGFMPRLTVAEVAPIATRPRAPPGARVSRRAGRSRRRCPATGASSSRHSRAGERARPTPGWGYPPQPDTPPGPPRPARAMPPPTRTRTRRASTRRQGVLDPVLLVRGGMGRLGVAELAGARWWSWPSLAVTGVLYTPVHS